MKKILCFALSFVAFACGERKKDEPSPSSGSGQKTYGYGKVYLKASSLGLAESTSSNPTNCEFSLDVYRGEGVCLTPLSVSGMANQLDFMADVAGRASTRIFSKDDSTTEAGEIASGADFNFKNIANSKLVGNNTLFDEYSQKPTYKALSVSLNYIKYQLSLKDKFVTVLLPTYTQPFASFAKETCGLTDEESTQDRYKKVDFLAGMSFKRGDFLFCVKDTLTAECSAGDYKWLDTTTKTLTTTRPNSPKTSYYLANEAVTCSGGSERRFGFNFKPIGFVASFETAQQFKLYSDLSHGQGSNENLGTDQSVSPYYIYTYVSPSNVTTRGSNLVVTIDINPANSVFIETYRASDISSTSLELLLNNIQLKSQWAYDQKKRNNVDGGFSTHYSGMTATATIEVTGGTTPPTAKDQL